MALAARENLEATHVATVTEEPRLKLFWRGKPVVDMARSFIDTNGAASFTKIKVLSPDEAAPASLPEKAFGLAFGLAFGQANGQANGLGADQGFADGVKTILSDLNVASQRGLVEMFDSSIGASTVLMPYGGKLQKTPIQTMACKIPVENGETTTASLMSYGFDPFVSSWSPFHGAEYAVMDSVAKVVAAGGDYHKIRFTFQEFYQKLRKEEDWGKPFAALLGGYEAQMRLGLPSIGGKDSMSGSFDDINVPPTLISLAVDTISTDKVVTPEFKEAGHQVVYLPIPLNEDGTVDFEGAMALYDQVAKRIEKGKIHSAYAVPYGGIVEAVFKMALGNGLGFSFNEEATSLLAAAPVYGSLIVETTCHHLAAMGTALGEITEEPVLKLSCGQMISMDEAEAAYNGKLERVFKLRRRRPRFRPTCRSTPRLRSTFIRAPVWHARACSSRFSRARTVSTTRPAPSIWPAPSRMCLFSETSLRLTSTSPWRRS